MPARRLTSSIRKYSLSGISGRCSLKTGSRILCHSTTACADFCIRFLDTLKATNREKRSPVRPHNERASRAKRSAPDTRGVLAGIHPVREALRAERALDRILIARGAGGPRLQEIIDAARERAIPLRFEPREALDRASNNAAHQGVVAFGASQHYAELEQVIEGTQLLVVLDGVEDPHNLGAIVRSAHAAGAAAVLIPERRAAGLTEAVSKAAAGALEHLPVVRIGNVSQTLDELKRRGFWIYGLDERAHDLY